MSQHLAQSIASALHLRAALIAPGEAHVLSAALADLAAADPAVQRAAWELRKTDLLLAYGFGEPEDGAQAKPFAFADGTAIIPVHGVLINRFAGSWGFATGYNFIRSQAQAAAADPDVERIVYDVDSPGGTVAGCEETSDALYALRGAKPSMAVVDSNCFSAAYWISSAADRIAVTPSGGAGSIGVVATHVSMEKMLSDVGIKVSLIHAGKFKVEGNPFEDLSEESRAAIQADVDTAYARFVGAVARNREGLDEKAVKATEARCFRAEDALREGLVDAVETPSAAVAGWIAAERQQQEQSMSVKKDEEKLAERSIEQTAAEARAEERRRFAEITGCDEAKGKGKLAQAIAADTDLDAPAAKKLLAAAAPEPPAEAAAPGRANGFRNAMATTGNPNIGPDGREDDGSGEEKQEPGAKARAVLDSMYGPRKAQQDTTRRRH